MNFADYLTQKLPAVEAEIMRGLPAAPAAATAPVTATPAAATSAPSAPATPAAPAAPAAPATAASTPSERTRADLNTYLYQPLAHFSAGGGKRVRPVLCCLGTEAVGGSAEAALPVACAIEDFQSAALIHDDIADKSELRRGEKCLYKTLGTGLAINVGDSALVNVVRRVTVADHLSDQLKIRVIDALLAMQEHTLEGQALDLGWAQNERWDVTSEQYLFMALSKTAYYSAAYPLVLGALIGGADQKTLDALKDFGLKVGLAFQLQDDLLNLVGNAEVQGKDFRSDITEGKRTLAVVYALEHLGSAERTELVSILSAHTGDTLELQRAVELMESANAIKFVRTHALALVDEAKHVLENVILTKDARDTLLSMADFFVNRER